MDFLNRIVNKPDFLLGLLSVLSCALVVFCSGSAASICYPSIKLPLLLFAVALWCFASLGRLKHLICCRVADWTAVLFMLVLIASIVMRQGSGFFSELQLMCILVIAYLMVKNLGPELIARSFIIVIVVLSGIALVAYVLFCLMGITPPLPTMTNYSGSTTYYNGVLFCIDAVQNEGRNCSVFWEPSIFAGYINICFILMMVFKIEQPRWVIVLLIVALISTASSGGLIEFLVVLSVYAYSRKGSALLSLGIALLALVFFVAYEPIAAFLLSLNYDVFIKIFGAFSNGSTLTRIECPQINLQIWLSNPLFGFGLSGADELYVIMREASSVSAIAQTSTPTFMLAAFGVAGVLYSVIWIIAIVRQCDASVIRAVLLLLLFGFFLNEVPCTYFLSMYLLLFVFLAHKSFTELKSEGAYLSSKQEGIR